MLHSVSALPVQAGEMRQVVTSYSDSVTRKGNVKFRDGRGKVSLRQKKT